MRTLTSLLGSATLALLAPTAEAATHYVAPGGDDGGPGTLASPLATLAEGSARAAPGDTVEILAGTYHERLEPPSSGEPGNPIIYRAHGSDEVVIDGAAGGTEDDLEVVVIWQSNIALEGLTIRNQAYLSHPSVMRYWVVLAGDDIRMTGCQVIADGDALDNYWQQHALSRAIAVSGRRVTIEDGYIRGPAMGVVVVGSSEPSLFVLRRTTIEHNGSDNVVVGSVQECSDDTALQGILIEDCTLDYSYEEDNIQWQADYLDTHCTQASDCQARFGGSVSWQCVGEICQASCTQNYGDECGLVGCWEGACLDRCRFHSNRGTVVRRTRLGHAAEDCLDMKATDHVLLDQVVCHSATGDNDGPTDNKNDDEGGAGIELGSGDVSRNVILRRSVLLDNHTGAKMYEGYHYYSNAFINNRRSYRGANGTAADASFSGVETWSQPTTHRGLVNNMFVGQPNDGVVRFRLDYGDKFFLNNNLYWDYGAPVVFFHRMGADEGPTVGLPAWQQALATFDGYAYLGGKDAASLEADPGFENVPQYPIEWDAAWNFDLLPSSVAIDAGGPLTFTTAAGSGTEIPVLDAAYFYDGFGFETGDRIVVGDDHGLVVTAADFPNALLTVDRAIQWQANEPVSFSFVGSAPDIGPREYDPHAEGGSGGAGGGVGASAGQGGVGGAGASAPGATDDAEGGCGCRLGSSAGTTHSELGLLSLGLLALRRRRRGGRWSGHGSRELPP